MDMQGEISGTTLNAKWTDCRNLECLDAVRFALTIQRCEEKLNCYTVKTKNNVMDNSISITEEVFSKCTLYNVRLDAVSNNSLKVMSDELIVRHSSGCNSQDVILGIGFSLLLVFLIAAIIGAYYYHKKHPIHSVQRARSRVYTRLYGQECYHNPIKRDEFIETVDKIINQPQDTKIDLVDTNGASRQASHQEERVEEGKDNLEVGMPFSEEFERLERLAFDTIQRRTTVAEMPKSQRRNRYNDIVPFDATRVLISPPYKVKGDLEASDYINASFISDVASRGGQYLPKRYIAAQGPGEDTTPAFWEMIWQLDIRVVVMLTNLVEGHGFNHVKCNMYWPDDVGGTKWYNDLEVQLFDSAEAPNYVIRKFDVTHKVACMTRVVVQIQYINWKDRQAPSDPVDLLQLVQLSRVMYTQHSPKESHAPLLVHCSAGVGRTGTFVCVDQMMRAVENNGGGDVLDIFHTVYQLRRDRRYMVQTRAQYEYVYKCVAAYILIKEKKISCCINSPL